METTCGQIGWRCELAHELVAGTPLTDWRLVAGPPAAARILWQVTFLALRDLRLTEWLIMRRNWIALILVTLLSCTLSVALGTNASAAPSYEQKSPYADFGGYRCGDSYATLDWREIIGYDTVWGVVYLRYSRRCATIFAYVNFGGPLNSSEYGNAHVRGWNGENYTCDTPGGNGRVVTGQTSCYTPMTTDFNGWVEGYYYSKNSSGGWVMKGFGTTKPPT